MKMMEQTTLSKGKMLGSAIIGIGSYRFKHDSGREGDWKLLSFSPRKQVLTSYLMTRLARDTALLEMLGRHKSSKSCLCISRFDDFHHPMLRKPIQRSAKHTRESTKAW